MKKLLYLFLFICLNFQISYAIELEHNNFKFNIYSNIYGDFFYKYNKPSSYTNNIEHQFASYAFTGSSNAGISIEYGKTGFVFEAGISDIIRKYYLQYNINKEKKHFILIGRDTTIAHFTFGQISDNLAGLSNYGTLIDKNRRLQIRYGILGFQIAFILPYLSSWNQEYVNDTSSLYDGYINIPRIELAYDFKNKYMEMKTFAGYGVYMYNNNIYNKIIHSATIGLGSKLLVNDKSNVYLSLFYGYNNNMTNSLTNAYTINFINNTMNVTNIHSFGVAAGFKYDYNKYITTQTGLGYTFNYGETYDSIDDALGAYLNVQIKVNKYFSIIPELSLFNNMQSNTKQSEGYSFMAGILMLLQI